MARMNRPRKVYVITKGSYSDYHICMVTMDRNRAEKLKKLLDGKWIYDEANIEEYILDEAKETGRVYYIDFRNDESVEVHIDEYMSLDSSKYPYITDWYDDLRIYVRAKDEGHALKIAQDEYAKWKAEKEGIV